MTTHPTAGSAAANQYGVFKVHYATERQVGFIANLLRDRDASGLDEVLAAELSEIAAQVETGRVSKKAASRGIDILLSLPERRTPAKVVTPAGPPATDKQVAFVKRLLVERELEGTMYNAPAWVSGIKVDGKVHYPADHMTKREASDIIEALLAAPKRAKTATGGGGAVEGIHFVDGQVVKVQRAVHGSGNLYAKLLVVDGHGEGHFEYAPGLVNQTSTSTLMTREQAAEFGRLYGMCAKCGATLTDETSIERGYGPVCAASFAS